MSRLITNSIRSTSASADAITFDGSGNATFPANATCSGTATGFGGGKILQVLQTVKTDTFSSSTVGSDVDITGLSVSITPASTSNKILVSYDTNISMPNGGYAANVHLKRDSTKIYQGDADGSIARSSQSVSTTNDTIGHFHEEMVHGLFLDSPNTTSAITYKISINLVQSGNSFFVNKLKADSSSNPESARYPSSITVMEVAA